MEKKKGSVVMVTLKLITVEPYVFFCLLGYAVRLVSYQNLLMDKACRNTFGYSDDICDDIDHHPREQAKCLEIGNNLYTMDFLLACLPAIVVATFVGPWSDKYSRRYPLIFAMSGMLLEGLFSTILASIPGISSVWIPFAALFSGVTGGFLIGTSAPCSYISDITDERSRPTRFAVLEFSFVGAVILGNVVGGQIFKHYGYVAVLSVAPICFGCGLLYAIFVVKETKPPVPPEKRYEMFRDLLRTDNIKQSYKTCSRKRAGNLRLQIWLLVLIEATYKFVDIGTLAIGFVFAKQMYKWDVSDFSNANTIFYACNALMTVAVVPLLSKKFRLHEAAIGLVGVLSMMSKMVLQSVAYTPTIFYFAWISGTLGSAASIAVRSRLSKLVNKEEIGRAFSLLGTIESIAPLLGTVIFLQIYNASLTSFTGLAFAVAVICFLPSAVIFSWMMRMPTISLSEYARLEEMKTAQPLATISQNYVYDNQDESFVY